MNRKSFVALALCALASATAVLPRSAQADTCLRVLESPFADGVCDLFVRLKKRLPAAPGATKPLYGRVNGASPIFGSAVRRPDVLGNPIEIALTASETPVEAYDLVCPFLPPCFTDVDQSRVTYPINLWLALDGSEGEGFCSGPYGGSQSGTPSRFPVDVTVVSCDLEP